MIIKHAALVNKWDDDKVLSNAKTLIIGSFNPYNNNNPKLNTDYYYGRKSNYLWKIIASLMNLREDYFLNSKERKISACLEHNFCFLDLINSIEVSSENYGKSAKSSSVETFVEENIFTDYTDQKLFTSAHRNINIKVTRNYNSKILELLERGSIDNVIHTLGNNTIDKNFNTKWKEKKLGVNGFQGFIKLINQRKNLLEKKSFSPSGYAVRTGGPEHFDLLSNWIKTNLNI